MHAREGQMSDNNTSNDGEYPVPHLNIRQLRKLCYSKRLNFLLGAGASQPAIPTLTNGQKPKDLIDQIRQVSYDLADGSVSAGKEMDTLEAYVGFISMIISILSMSNSRAVPRSTNIFTTNYDLFVEAAMDQVMQENYGVIFNDGANGYFRRYINTFNYDRSTALRGQFDNYNHETPTIRLIKPHGSINWRQSKTGKDQELIEVLSQPEENPFLVLPDANESEHTMKSRHFFEMLRLFNIELDKPQSILFVIGFSFQDKHIKGMVQRALQNPGLQVCIFAYSDETSEPDTGNAREDIMHNLGTISNPNLLILSPKDVANCVINLGKHDPPHADSKATENKSDSIRLNLKTVTRLLMPNNADSFPILAQADSGIESK